jgi:hypothetical protein
LKENGLNEPLYVKHAEILKEQKEIPAATLEQEANFYAEVVNRQEPPLMIAERPVKADAGHFKIQERDPAARRGQPRQDGPEASAENQMRLHSPQWANDISNPTAEQIEKAINQINHKDQNPYLILVDDSRENCFIQTLKKSPRRFTLENREGPHGPQWQARNVTTNQVKLAFLSYLQGNAEFKTAVEWRDITKSLELEQNRSKRKESSAGTLIEQPKEETNQEYISSLLTAHSEQLVRAILAALSRARDFIPARGLREAALQTVPLDRVLYRYGMLRFYIDAIRKKRNGSIEVDVTHGVAPLALRGETFARL